MKHNKPDPERNQASMEFQAPAPESMIIATQAMAEELENSYRTGGWLEYTTDLRLIIGKARNLWIKEHGGDGNDIELQVLLKAHIKRLNLMAAEIHRARNSTKH